MIVEVEVFGLANLSDGEGNYIAKTYIVRQVDDYIQYLRVFKNGGFHIGEAVKDKWHIHLSVKNDAIDTFRDLLNDPETFNFGPVEKEDGNA
jgi:hypothetical protein